MAREMNPDPKRLLPIIDDTIDAIVFGIFGTAFPSPQNAISNPTTMIMMENAFIGDVPDVD